MRSELLLSENGKITSVGKGEAKTEPPTQLVGIGFCTRNVENNMEYPLKMMQLAGQPDIPLLCSSAKEMKSVSRRAACAPCAPIIHTAKPWDGQRERGIYHNEILRSHFFLQGHSVICNNDSGGHRVK